jgi:hypothetical protein
MRNQNKSWGRRDFFFGKRFFFSSACTLATVFMLANQAAAIEIQDPLKDYKGTIKKEASAQPTAVYSAWGKNMANRITAGKAKGVVIDNNCNTVAGVGNNTIQNPNGTVINNSVNTNNTVISINNKSICIP